MWCQDLGTEDKWNRQATEKAIASDKVTLDNAEGLNPRWVASRESTVTGSVPSTCPVSMAGLTLLAVGFAQGQLQHRCLPGVQALPKRLCHLPRALPAALLCFPLHPHYGIAPGSSVLELPLAFPRLGQGCCGGLRRALNKPRPSQIHPFFPLLPPSSGYMVSTISQCLSPITSFTGTTGINQSAE